LTLLNVRSVVRIAIIDDEVLVRESFRDCMESVGYMVETFGSAEDFLESTSRREAACLIVDMQLPGMSGLELQAKISDGVPSIPIVFVTAHGMEEVRERAMNCGASGFLSKPVRREELLNTVRAAIR
jgi:FixJ family two-component response regulator